MKWVIRLWVIGLIGLVGFAVAATVLPSPRPAPQVPLSHEALEADRVMTQQMGTDVGPGMGGGDVRQRDAQEVGGTGVPPGP